MRNCLPLVLPLAALSMTACSPLPPKHEVTYTITCEASSKYHRRYDYYHVPSAVDTQGTAARNVPAGQLLVGYQNSWSESGINNINHRYLGFAYRGFIFCNQDQMPKNGLVLSASLHFPIVSTESWSGTSASNTGSAAHTFFRLTAPFSGFSSNGDVITQLPHQPGNTGSASYSVSDGLTVQLTTTMNRIVNGADMNYGFMMAGPNESYQHNNDRFLTYYQAPVLTMVVLEDKPQWPSP